MKYQVHVDYSSSIIKFWLNHISTDCWRIRAECTEAQGQHVYCLLIMLGAQAHKKNVLKMHIFLYYSITVLYI